RGRCARGVELPWCGCACLVGRATERLAAGECGAGRGCPPFIAAIPAAGPIVNPHQGEWAGVWENYLVEDVVPWVDAHMPTIRSPSGRALEDLCAGGFGAVDIGLRHPGLFDGIKKWRPGPRGLSGQLPEGFISPISLEQTKAAEAERDFHVAERADLPISSSVRLPRAVTRNPNRPGPKLPNGAHRLLIRGERCPLRAIRRVIPHRPYRNQKQKDSKDRVSRRSPNLRHSRDAVTFGKPNPKVTRTPYCRAGAPL